MSFFWTLYPSRLFCHKKPNPILITLPIHFDHEYCKDGVSSPKSPSLWSTVKNGSNSNARCRKKGTRYIGIDGWTKSTLILNKNHTFDLILSISLLIFEKPYLFFFKSKFKLCALLIFLILELSYFYQTIYQLILNKSKLIVIFS